MKICLKSMKVWARLPDIWESVQQFRNEEIMETAIIIVWSVTLVVALVLTLWILKLVELIVRTEQDILNLAMTTLTARPEGYAAQPVIDDYGRHVQCPTP